MLFFIIFGIVGLIFYKKKYKLTSWEAIKEGWTLLLTLDLGLVGLGLIIDYLVESDSSPWFLLLGIAFLVLFVVVFKAIMKSRKNMLEIARLKVLASDKDKDKK